MRGLLTVAGGGIGVVVAGMLAALATGSPSTGATEAAEEQPRAIRRIVFLGNSLTHHGPRAEVDWDGDWGMAASAPEKDYVHLVTAAVAERTGEKPEILVRNIADFERGYADYDVEKELRDALDFRADLVVLAIGENVAPFESDDAGARFQAGVEAILAGTAGDRRPLQIVRSCFWENEAKDAPLRAAAEKAAAVYVDAGPLGRDEANAARSERPYKHAGVGAHPGDRGMKALADQILGVVFPDGPSAPSE